MLNRIRLTAPVLLVVLAMFAPTTAAVGTTDTPLRQPDDFTAPVVESPPGIQATETQGVLDDDPLGLVPKLPFVQHYSLDTDHWEVWLCGETGFTVSQAVAHLESAANDYYDAVSGGRYAITFSPGGIISGDPYCLNGFENGTYSTVGSPEGVFIVDSVTGGGYASPGIICSGTSNCPWIGTTFPASGRYAVVGSSSLATFPSIAVHELGHTLQWPHSNSGQSEYDNPIDLMSGNSAVGGWTESQPYGSLAFNRYQSGWIDAADVAIATPIYREVTLQPYDAAGTQMIVVLTGTPGVFYTLDARTRGTYDPIPAEWEGVEVYLIDHRCGTFSGPCPGIFRSQRQEPPNPEGVAHVLQPGESIVLENIQIEVLARNGSGYSVAVGDPANSLPFVDIAGSGFVDDIVWLAGRSITKGCNPPTNSRFCPAKSVTRGEMAAFLVRTLGLTDSGGRTFDDVVGTTFEADIAKLAAAGITQGCNPPDNTRFCPNDVVTRAQMAAFLVRAYHLTDNGGGNTFRDDDGSIFETDIAKLAAAGITRGCNPPANTEFCPAAAVTREQMAAFLHRAVSG